MIQINAIEFNDMREAIAGAHLLLQAVKPVLKQRHVPLDKNQRNLLEVVPETIAHAFSVVAAITQREKQQARAFPERLTVSATHLDEDLILGELRDVAALNMPDLTAMMVTAWHVTEELEQISRLMYASAVELAPVFAIFWEAGRRYGLIQAAAMFDSFSADFVEAIKKELAGLLDTTLDLPAPECECHEGINAPVNPHTAEELGRCGGLTTIHEVLQMPAGDDGPGLA